MELYKHWRLEQDSDHILWIIFDKAHASVNSLNHEAMEEFSAILDEISPANEYKGIVIASAKTSGFIAGADIHEFKDIKNEESALNVLKKGQEVFAKLAAITLPTVALIQGFCLGGGLELALACRYRIAEDDAKTRLGLPEVKLGIQPGWGGSVRLLRLVDSLNGLNLILSGHTISAKAAAKLGVIDAAVPKRHLAKAAKFYILQAPAPRQLSQWQKLSHHKLIRPIIAKLVRKKLNAKANPIHYPAPFMVLDNWEKYGVNDSDAFEREAQTCSKLFMTGTCHNLVRVYFLQELLKGLAQETEKTYQHVHVIGSGTMGGDIAAWCALRGLKVTLQDVDPAFLAKAFQRAYTLFKDKLKEPHLIQKALDLLIPDVAGHGVSAADIIIEAVVENPEIKQQVFKTVESKARASAILATNTSSILLDEINVAMQNPGRLVGIHFFNPVAMMQLVEVVKGDKTEQEVYDKAINFVRQIDKLPLPVSSQPGFLVNRVLFPYMMEAMQMLDEKIPAAAIDKAMTDFGMPIGPVALADMVGLDVCLSVADHLGKHTALTIPPRLKQLVVDNHLGKKTGQGFYHYDKKGKIITSSENTGNHSLDEIANRLVLKLINESFECLRKGVVSGADMLDAGMIFGTGFAPFRGGPINYAKSQGIHEQHQHTKSHKTVEG